jgi:FkbM family methyltransferase
MVGASPANQRFFMKEHILNRLLPMRLRTWSREFAKRLIPSMRHLDMPMRMENLRSVGFDPKVVYDIGCASGEWAQMAAKLWPAAQIYGFEPNQTERENLEAVKRQLAHFEFFQSFLGPEAGTVTYVNRGHQTSLLDDTAKPPDSSAVVKAPVRVLDQMIQQGEIRPPDFMKLDVQGFELDVLRGGERALAHAQAVLLEVSFRPLGPNCPLAHDVIAFMTNRNMIVYDVMGILRRQSDDALFQMDLLFVKKDHPLAR